MGAIPDEAARSLVDKANQIFRGDQRKLDAYERWLVYEEAYPQLIADRIGQLHEDPATIARMTRWVDVSCNLALDILPQISVVWKNGAKRTVQDASDKQNGAMRDLYERLCVDSLAPEWNAQASYYGELLVMPQVIDGDVHMVTALPHMYEPIPHPTNPFVDAGYIYTTNQKIFAHGTESDHVQLDPQRMRADFVILDDVGWRHYSGTTGELIAKQEHNLGYVPAVRMSFHSSFGGTRWSGAKRMQRLHDSTIAAAMVNTTMSYVRKAQNRQLLIAVGDFDDGNDPNTPDPETGQKIQTSTPKNVEIKTLDFDTNPENFIRQIQWIYQSAAQAHGGFAILDPRNTSTMAPQVKFSHDAQTEVRNKQLPYARKFERDLAATTVDIMRSANHPDAASLPDADQIRESLTVDFGNLSRSFSSVSEQKDYFDFLKANGAATPIDLVRSMEGVTLADSKVKDIIANNLDFIGWFNNELATRNMQLGEGGIQTMAEVNGAMGPEVRDANKPPAQPPKPAQDSADKD